MRHTRCREPQLSTVFGRKQKRWFLAGEKTPEFTKFQCENARKNFALFALIGNTAFQPHINNLAHQLSKAVGILSKVKVYLNTLALCSLYYALFHCHETYLKKLATLKHKAVKIVGNGTWNDRATPYFAKLKIFKLQDLVKLEIAAFRIC